MIFPPGGAPMFAPMPGYDIKSAYEKHMNGSAASGTALTTAEGKADAPSAAAGSVSTPLPTGFDATSKTVTLQDGRSVVFVDNDDLKVLMPGPAGTKTYELHFHKAGAGGFMKQWANREQSRVGAA